MVASNGTRLDQCGGLEDKLYIALRSVENANFCNSTMPSHHILLKDDVIGHVGERAGSAPEPLTS